MMALLPWLKSWKLWLAIGLALAAWWIATTILAQAEQIGTLQADIATKQAAIDELGQQLADQHAQHQIELLARDTAAAVEHEQHAQAESRASMLAHQLNQARVTDAAIDACLGMPLPAGIADSLRQ